MRNYLICWIENEEKKWDMIKDADKDAFLLSLMEKEAVDNHTIFIIPTNGFVNGIWLQHTTHKSNRVDFNNFFKDLGVIYEKPKENPKIEVQEKHFDKYGWISPDGRYFHCGFQGHAAMAEKICFGMVETNSPVRYLEDHGWVKIYKPTFGEYGVYVGGDYVINHAQMKTLMKLGLEHAKDISAMLCKKAE